MSAGTDSTDRGWLRELALTVLAATAVVGLLSVFALVVLGPNHAASHSESEAPHVAVTSVSLAKDCTTVSNATVVSGGYPGSLLVRNATDGRNNTMTRLLLSEPPNLRGPLTPTTGCDQASVDD